MTKPWIQILVVGGAVACGATPAPRASSVSAPAADPPAVVAPTPTPTETLARALVVVPAPITTEGHVAGKPTDLVFVIEPDGDPAVAGRALARGDALRIALPRALARRPEVAISPDTDTNAIATKGWPQGAVQVPEQYRIGFDAATHALTLTALVDLPATPPANPGIKAIHVRGGTFLNPAVGSYPVTIEHVDAAGAARTTWAGAIEIVAQPPAARLAPSNFHLPPGTNANFQIAGPNQVLPLRLGLLLWANGAPLDHVGIAPRDLARFPRYTGGLLVQDTTGDGKLDPARDRVIGGVIGAAPDGAKGQAATSPRGKRGRPILSGEVVRDAGFPRGGGKPVPGLLVVEFTTGDRAGAYQPTFELTDGNAVRFTLRVGE